MKIYFVRHGETDWNKVRRLQGKADIPLNDFGIHLAKETGKGLKDVPFDFACTSPLVRARQTAELILGTRSIPVIPDERLEEIGFGDAEGVCWREGNSKYADAVDTFFNAPENYRPPHGGETLHALLERTNGFLKELSDRKDYASKTILVSTHGAALCALLANIRNTPAGQFWGSGVHKNCAVTIVNLQDGMFEIQEEGIIYYKDEVKPW